MRKAVSSTRHGLSRSATAAAGSPAGSEPTLAAAADGLVSVACLAVTVIPATWYRLALLHNSSCTVYTRAEEVTSQPTREHDTIRDTFDDPSFPRITYRRGAAGQPTPALRGTGIRVQTIVVATQRWEMTPAQIAAEYELSEAQVDEALAFYEAHRPEIDAAIAAERAMEAAYAQAAAAPGR